MTVSGQTSTVGVLAFLFALVVSLSPHTVLAGQQTTTNTTTATTTPEGGIISQPLDLPPPLVAVDDEPLYQSTSGNLTSLRVVDVVSPSVVIREGSFMEKAFMKNIGNVTNTGTYVENIDYNEGIVHGFGKGIIATDNGGRDMISWNAYDIGLLSGYGRNNGNSTDPAAGSSALNTDRITIYRGIIFFSTDSERLSFMNNIVGLYITQVNDENGSSLRQIWDWRNNNY